MDSSSINITPTSSSSIRQQQPSISSDRKKESFRNQFKRLVGWGSSYNAKKQPNSTIPPPITTPFSNNNNNMNPGMASLSNSSFVSTSSTPFPPTPRTLNSAVHIQHKSHPINEAHFMDINTPVSLASQQSIVNSSVHASLSACSKILSNPSSVHASLSASSKIVSNHSTLSSVSSTSSVTSEELSAAAVVVVAAPLEETEVEVEDQELMGEEGEIQKQYAMWMTTHAAIPEEAPDLKTVSSSVDETRLLLPAQSNKSSIISNITDDDPMSSALTSSVVEPDLKPDMHPMTSGQEVDDLFLLVAHGVDFLTCRENSQWEEYGGYDFHPWNRPQGSFSVRHHQKRTKEPLPTLPEQLTSNESRPKIETPIVPPEIINEEPEEPEEETISPPSTPLVEEQPSALAKRILGAKPEVQTSLNEIQPQQHQSLDDEELQRIVAAHILF